MFRKLWLDACKYGWPSSVDDGKLKVGKYKILQWPGEKNRKTETGFKDTFLSIKKNQTENTMMFRSASFSVQKTLPWYFKSRVCFECYWLCVSTLLNSPKSPSAFYILRTMQHSLFSSFFISTKDKLSAAEPFMYDKIEMLMIKWNAFTHQTYCLTRTRKMFLNIKATVQTMAGSYGQWWQSDDDVCQRDVWLDFSN